MSRDQFVTTINIFTIYFFVDLLLIIDMYYYVLFTQTLIGGVSVRCSAWTIVVQLITLN